MRDKTLLLTYNSDLVMKEQMNGKLRINVRAKRQGKGNEEAGKKKNDEEE